MPPPQQQTILENFVRLIAGPDTLSYFKSRYFTPYILYPPPLNYNKTAWAAEEYGTRYMYGPDDRPIQLTDMGDSSIGAIFKSTDGPPIPFYRHLVSRFPFLIIQYEFCDGERCGHGRLSAMNRSEPQTFSVGSEAASRHTWILQLPEPLSEDDGSEKN